MKTLRLFLAVLLAVAPAAESFAAYQTFPVCNRIAYIDDGRLSIQPQVSSTEFRVDVLSDQDYPKPEEFRNGRPFITAQPGETYSVRLTNPLPVRVGANLTVDGLNSISGKPSGIADGEKWIIDPYSSITIRGWQVNNGEARRFFFTKKPKSYAKWRGKQLDKDLAVNCGVIGAAFFWSQQELDAYYVSHPIYRYSHVYSYGSDNRKGVAMDQLAAKSMNAAAAPAPESDVLSNKESREASVSAAQQAGTGMGERELNPTISVDFHYDTGMYDLAKAVVIYYDFARPTPVPNPFPEGDYAPEM